MGPAEGEGGFQPLLPKMILTVEDRVGRGAQGTSSLAMSAHTLQTDELMLGENRHVFEKASLAA